MYIHNLCLYMNNICPYINNICVYISTIYNTVLSRVACACLHINNRCDTALRRIACTCVYIRITISFHALHAQAQVRMLQYTCALDAGSTCARARICVRCDGEEGIGGGECAKHAHAHLQHRLDIILHQCVHIQSCCVVVACNVRV